MEYSATYEDILSMLPSRKHHYLSQFYLKLWCRHDDKNQFGAWVMHSELNLRQGGRIGESHFFFPKQTFFIMDYNTDVDQPTQSEMVAEEARVGAIENKASRSIATLTSILEQNDMTALQVFDLQDILHLAAMFSVKSPITRARMISRMEAENDFDRKKIFFYEQGCEALVLKALMAWKWRFIYSPEGHFVTSLDPLFYSKHQECCFVVSPHILICGWFRPGDKLLEIASDQLAGLINTCTTSASILVIATANAFPHLRDDRGPIVEPESYPYMRRSYDGWMSATVTVGEKTV